MSGRFAPRSTTCSLLRNRANLGSLLRNGGFHLQRSHFHAATEQQPITARTAATPITLRPYQQDCIDLCLDDFSKGRRRQLVSLPVGSGKTVIFANLIRRLPAPTPKANKTLVLCHRAELLHQARKTIQRTNPELRVEIEQGSLTADHLGADVIVASVPTIGRMEPGSKAIDQPRGTGGARLLRFDPNLFKCIIVDEAHHVAAASYLRVLRHFGALEDKSSILLWGCSATVNRHDGIGLEQVFQRITYHKSLEEMIREGWLVDIIPRVLHTDVSLEGLSVQAGDFAEGQLEMTIDIDQRNDLVVAKWREIAQGTRQSTLVFAAGVNHAHSITQLFNDIGVEAHIVTGDTPKEERARIVERFTNREFPVLVNCMVFTEGVDIPNIDCIIMARPTLSSVLFQQMLGRGLRLFEGKKDLLVLDVVDNFGGHPLMTVPSLFGLKPLFDAQGMDVLSAKDEMRRLQVLNVAVSDALSIEDARNISLVELENQTFVPDKEPDPDFMRLQKISKQPWVRVRRGYYVLYLGAKTPQKAEVSVFGVSPLVVNDENMPDYLASKIRTEVERDIDSFPMASYVATYGYAPPGSAGDKAAQSYFKRQKPLRIASGQDIASVFNETNDWITRNMSLGYKRRDAPWRGEAASQAQKNFFNQQMTQSNNRKRRRIAAIMDDMEDDDEDDDEGYTGPRLPAIKGNTLTKEMAGFFLDKKFFEQQHNNLQPKDKRVHLNEEDEGVQNYSEFKWYRVQNDYAQGQEDAPQINEHYVIPVTIHEPHLYLTIRSVFPPITPSIPSFHRPTTAASTSHFALSLLQRYTLKPSPPAASSKTNEQLLKTKALQDKYTRNSNNAGSLEWVLSIAEDYIRENNEHIHIRATMNGSVLANNIFNPVDLTAGAGGGAGGATMQQLNTNNDPNNNTNNVVAPVVPKKVPTSKTRGKKEPPAVLRAALLRKKAEEEPATEKQIELLRKLQVPITHALSKAQASLLIDQRLATTRVKSTAYPSNPKPYHTSYRKNSSFYEDYNDE